MQHRKYIRRLMAGFAGFLGALMLVGSLCDTARAALVPPPERIDLLHADNLRFDERDPKYGDNTRLSGDVRLLHKGMYMYCDSALFNEASQSVRAFGHVKLVQGDTLTLTGDSLDYIGDQMLCIVYDNVRLTHRKQVLLTDRLYHDRTTATSYYNTGGQLIDGKSTLTSIYGEYHNDTRLAYFDSSYGKYNSQHVEISDPDFRLLTDTLHYDTNTKWAHAVGPTNIFSKGDRVYTEDGYYNTKTEEAKLRKNTQAFGENRIMKGDSIYYNRQTGDLEAFRNAECLDTLNKNLLSGDYCYYNEQTGEGLAYDRALLRDFSQGPDTFYVHADTLRLHTPNIGTDSVYRVLHGYYHVRAYRKDVQAVSDSLVFSTLEKNVLTLYHDPIVWSDNQQILGEEIKVFLNDSIVDSVHVDRQALMVEQVDSAHFNQVASNLMRSYYDEKGELKENQAHGNVMVVNFPLETDSVVLYQNYTETSKARMFMKNRRMHRLWAPASHGFFYPIGLAPEERTHLPNFAWFDYIRPLSPEDIWVWRPKKAGSELKKSIRREAPLQYLKP